MNKLFTLLLVPFLFIFACGGDINEEAISSNIKELVELCAKDFENADITSFVNRGTEDLIFFTLDGKSLNKEDTKKTLQPMFERWENRKMKIEDLEIFVNKNISWARYKSTFTFDSQYGRTEMISLNTIIFQMDQNQNWKLHHFHMSRY